MTSDPELPGREVLCTLALPLSLKLAAELLQGIGEAAKRAGYRDVALLTDGSNRIVARLAAESTEEA